MIREGSYHALADFTFGLGEVAKVKARGRRGGKGRARRIPTQEKIDLVLLLRLFSPDERFRQIKNAEC